MRITCGGRVLVAKTCKLCLELKDAKHFSWMKGGFRQSYCIPCHNKHGKPQIRGQQQKALKGAVRHWQPWTMAEIENLREMAQEGATGPQMATALGRSLYAVYTMKRKILKGLV